MVKKLTTIIAALTAATLVGCGRPQNPNYFTAEGEYEGHKVKIGLNENGRMITMDSSEGNEFYIFARDGDLDGRFERMGSHGIVTGNGDSVTNYLKKGELEKVYNKLNSERLNQSK